MRRSAPISERRTGATPDIVAMMAAAGLTMPLGGKISRRDLNKQFGMHRTAPGRAAFVLQELDHYGLLINQ
jgi:hypothetical protein